MTEELIRKAKTLTIADIVARQKIWDSMKREVVDANSKTEAEYYDSLRNNKKSGVF